MRDALVQILEEGLREDKPGQRTTPTRRQRVTLLLGSYADVLGPAYAESVGREKPSSRILSHAPLWKEGSYSELDELLVVLRRRAPVVFWHTRRIYIDLKPKDHAVRRHKAALGVEFLKQGMPRFIIVPDEILTRGGFKAERERAAA